MNLLKSVFYFLIILVVAGNLVACNYQPLNYDNTKTPEAFSELAADEKLTMMNYNYIYTRIIGPKCAICHGQSGNVNLESYENIVSQINGIQKTVFQENSMPKRDSLTSTEKRLLWNWLTLGAPKDSASAKPPETNLLEAKFDSINKNIFQVKCMTCHNLAGTGKRILLDKESLLNSPLELIIPGNSEESGLIVALERIDDKRMPPAKEGYTALKAEEIDAIRKWIDAGAKD